ncbi:hypothetical protein N0V88_006001 [Collariella sp. IMI 366227]|nr:hypothetical protein N0V88_006001 [Collariella sp. IMI 366227]
MLGIHRNLAIFAEGFPRTGFRWQRGQRSRRILRSDRCDGRRRRAIIDTHLYGGNGGMVRKGQTQGQLIFQNARARDEYERTTPTALAHAIDGLVAAASCH